MMKTNLVVLLFLFSIGLGNAQNIEPISPTEVMPGWYKVSILYPYEDGKHFDMDYYSQKHMPMVASLFGDKLKHYFIDSGLSGRTPNDPMTYIAVGGFYFEKLSDYKESFGPNAEKIRGDIPNYTNIQPIVQISQVIK
ncbi:EthD family reductase [Flagellimonas sp.]|uniref:EthD family reductase n=1 Tax=Flagellimonas sp. TaxID=2058762 RepID=UPI003F49DD14